MQNRNNELGKMIRSAREQLGISQAELSKRLASGGGLELGNTTIAKIENGTRGIAVQEAVAISKSLGIPWNAFKQPGAPMSEKDRLEGAVKASSNLLYEDAASASNQLPLVLRNIANLLEATPNEYPPAREISAITERIQHHILQVIHLEGALRKVLFDPSYKFDLDDLAGGEQLNVIFGTGSLMEEVEKRGRQSDGEG